jgi:cytochrome c oxidase subunit 3
MTFILILSSVTMVLAVEAGHRKSRDEVAKWVFLTIIGGAAFLSCQAYEWYHFIHGTEEGAILLTEQDLSGARLQVDVAEYTESHHGEGGHAGMEGIAVLPIRASKAGEGQGDIIELRLRDGSRISDAKLLSLANTYDKNREEYKDHFVEGGANLLANEYGPQAFADLFFFVTGFHGTHVFSGVVLLVILYLNVKKGTYDRRGHYEMTEKIGLYWHFVDLVWVFVFTFFYLV